MKDQDLICWVDLETTGTDEHLDSILEVGVVLTRGPQLEEVARGSWVVRPETGMPEAERRMQAGDGYVWSMHQKNGLWEEVKLRGQIAPTVDRLLCEFLDTYGVGKKRIPLAGSGVAHFDRRFIAAQLFQFDRRLTYWSFDVGVMRRWLRELARVDPPHSNQGDSKVHRALDDIVDHVQEARAVTELLSVLQQVLEEGAVS